MRRAAFHGLLALLCLTLGISGCGGGSGDETVWTGTGVHGYVTAGRGDNAIAGAEVDLYAITEETADTYKPSGPLPDPPFLTTNTSHTGYYRFSGLTPGVYLVEVAATDTRAGARYQHLVVGADQQIRADLITDRNFVASAPTQLPFVVSITSGGSLLQAGATLTGPVTLTVSAESADPTPLPVKMVFVKIGHLSNGSDSTLDNGSAQLDYTFDSTRLGNGQTFVYVTAYDLNNNTATVRVPVVVANGVAGSPPPAPEIVRVVAWTFGEPSGYKSPRRQFNLPPLQTKIGGHPVSLPGAASQDAGARAVGGSASAMVHIQIKPDPGATSYRIYRRTGKSGSFGLIGERMNRADWYEEAYYADPGAEESFQALWFNDLDPALRTSQNYYYRVKAVNRAGETDSGHVYMVTVLPKFQAQLAQPDGSAPISAATNPAFTWSASGGFGTAESMLFLVYVLNKNDEDPASDMVPFSWLHWVEGGTRATYGAVDAARDAFTDGTPFPHRPLIPGSIYEWDLLLALSYCGYADMEFGESYAESYSYPRLDQGSSNGAFIFATAP